LLLAGFFNQCHGFFKRVHNQINIANFLAAVGAGGVNFYTQANATVHSNGKRLGATHATQASGENKFASQ